MSRSRFVITINIFPLINNLPIVFRGSSLLELLSGFLLEVLLQTAAEGDGDANDGEGGGGTFETVNTHTVTSAVVALSVVFEADAFVGRVALSAVFTASNVVANRCLTV